MAAPHPVALAAAEPLHAPHSDPAPQFTSFILRAQPAGAPALSALRNENPLCRLAATCGAAAGACDHACGIAEPTEQAAHTCPLGMELRRARRIDAHSADWIGRRFTSVAAFHAALDRLVAAGYDEETVLAHLPSNPIAFPHEFDEAAPGAIFTTPATPAVASSLNIAPAPQPVAPQAQQPGESQSRAASLGDLLEYFSQIQALLASAPSREAAAERFLHALTPLAPFRRMEIYLPDSQFNAQANGPEKDHDAGLVIAAAVEQRARGRQAAAEQLQWQTCRLEIGALGDAAFRRGVVLAKSHEEAVHEFIPTCQHPEIPALLALPLMDGAGRALGVWLAAQAAPALLPSLGGQEWFRTLTFLARQLACTLEKLAQPAAAPAPAATEVPPTSAPAKPAVAPSSTLEALLVSEIARAARQQVPLALVCLELRNQKPLSATKKNKLKADQLAAALATTLRPFDTLVIAAPAQGILARWQIALPATGDTAAQMVAARLLTTLEDELDARGGMEEYGLTLATGIALLGPETAEPARLAAAAEAAAAASAAQSGTIALFNDLELPFPQAAE